jgi:hypothetical protein
MGTLTSMGLFVRAVDTSSFSATVLHISLALSAVSKQISRLEDRLGVRPPNCAKQAWNGSISVAPVRKRPPVSPALNWGLAAKC